jgi:hypothetical protein
METQFNGNFDLFEVNKIVKKNNFYEIRFRNTNKRFAGIYLHSFVTDEMVAKSLVELKSGDKIWIDISAYTAHKSLFVHNPFGTIGTYSRARKFNINN